MRPGRLAASTRRRCSAGAALNLAGELLFKQRMHRTLSLPRLVAAAGVLLAALPAVETARYAQARRSLRNP